MSKDLKKILSVDDDDDIRLIAGMVLKKKGYFDVTSQASGAQALEYLLSLEEREYPDLILLDVMMPVMDGPQTLEKIRSEGGALAQIPIIFLTAKCQPEQVQLLIEKGAVGVIAKPFDPQGLVDEVQKIWATL